jgi:AcrR family transcriptional regulator
MQFGKTPKEQLILETAQKRFGLYGLEKTSMREIADDLNMSKASLYYYFPDKESLYKAVIEKEQAEFIEAMTNRMGSQNEADQLLLDYAGFRFSYFRTLLNLSRIRVKLYNELKPVLKDIMTSFREKEQELVVQIIEKGISDGVFFHEDAGKAAMIFLDVLRGMRMIMLNENFFLTLKQEEHDIYLEKTIAITEIFIRGLKNKNR